MVTPRKCPACGGHVMPGVEDCPNCPASFRAEGAGVSEYHQRRGRGNGPLVLVCVTVLLGFGAWRLLSKVVELGRRESEVMGVPSREMPPPAAPEHRPPAQTLAREESPLIEITRLSMRKHGSRPRREIEWRLRGAVYDLVTLKPVSGINMVLKDIEFRRRIETLSDEAGHYRISVPPLPGRGYAVLFEHPGYAATAYLDPGAEAMLTKPENERRQLARELARSVMAPQTLQALDETPLITNFYLAPRDLR